MPTKRPNGKWRARVQYNGKRYNIGDFKTKREALAAEEKKQRELNRKMNQTIDGYKMSYEYMEHPEWFTRIQKWLKQRRKDKETTKKLENL